MLENFRVVPSRGVWWPTLGTWGAVALVAIVWVAGCGDGGGGGGGTEETGACEADIDCKAGRHCLDGACQIAAINCVDDTQCPPTLLCSNQGCRQQACTNNQQCHVDYECGGDGFCRKTGVCLSDAECPGSRCDGFTHQCTAPIDDGCGDARACDPGFSCVEGHCTPDDTPEGCQTDSECRPGTYCAPDGSCLSGCRLVEGACGANRVCDPSTRTCRDGCADDTQCPATSYCDATGTCVRGCRTSVDNCGPNRMCNPDSRACDCTGDEACTADEYCQDGACFRGCHAVPDNCQDGRICDPESHTCIATSCDEDVDCDDGQYCGGDGMCATGCRTLPDDCDQGETCDPVAHTCQGQSACARDADCPVDTYCDPQGACTAGCRIGGCPAGQVCELASRQCGCGDDSACADNQWCNAGVCRDGCRFNPDNCPENQFCDRATRACGCLNDEGCAADQYCANGLCRSGCRLAGQSCPDGVCDPLNHRCTCQSDAGCAAGEYCHNGACLPGCRIDPDDCAPDGVCDPQTRECRCITDAACPAGQYCTPDNLCAIGCRLDPDDCGAGSVCDERSRRCSCADDGGCPAGQYCRAGACIDGCRLAPDDCGAGQRCDEATRACVCGSDAACGADEYCAADGTCQRGCRTEPNNCAMGACDPAIHQCGCLADTDCLANEYCTENRTCAAGCRADPDNCGNGVCDLARRECVPPPCVRDADCAANQACGPFLVGDALELRCLPAIGRGRDSAECVSNLECASRSCVGGDFCFSACSSGADCQSGRCNGIRFSAMELPGQEFVFNSCTPPPQLCQANAQCGGGDICVYQGEDPLAPGTPVIACASPDPGAGIGEACAQDVDCASQVCLNQGVCWGPCRPALGAADCPAAQRCYVNSVYIIFDQGTPQESDDDHYGLPGCMPDRGSDTACPLGVCPGNEVCIPQSNQTFSGFDFLCRTPTGNGLSGAPCARDADCRSNTCLAGIGVCLGVCNPNDARTCANGTVCISANFTVWDAGTPANSADDIVAPINICVP